MPARRLDPERLLAALSAQLTALGGQPWAGPVTVAALGAGCADAVLAALGAGLTPQPGALRGAVIHTLGLLESQVPGRAVEVRIPPYAAVQCVPGPRHTRGTPPNVVETDALTWISLAAGRMTWAAAMRGGRVAASGRRADLSEYLPLVTAGGVSLMPGGGLPLAPGGGLPLAPGGGLPPGPGEDALPAPEGQEPAGSN